MTKILVIGDPHFKVSNVRETKEMVSSIIELCQNNNIDIIVILGDTLDRHETIHVSPLVRAIDFIDQLRKIAPVYLLIGNHDLKNNQQFCSEEHPFTGLKSWHNLFVIDKPLRDKDCVFVPYVPPGRFQEALDLCDWSNAKIIFAHQEFRGCKMGAKISTDGDIWPNDYPQIISGHIHDYQKPQDNILYVGTPIQHTYSDHDERTVSIIELETLKETRHGLNVRKKKIIRLNCNQVNNYILPLNYDLKIIITGNYSEIKSLNDNIIVKQWKMLGHKVTYQEVNIEYDYIPTREKYKYSTMLENLIQDKPVLTNCFNNLFKSA